MLLAKQRENVSRGSGRRDHNDVVAGLNAAVAFGHAHRIAATDADQKDALPKPEFAYEFSVHR